MQKLKINKLLKILFVMFALFSFNFSEAQQIFHKGYRVGTTWGEDILVLNDGYIAVGRVGSSVVFVIRTDFNGNVLWHKSYYNSQYSNKYVNNVSLFIENNVDTSLVFTGYAFYQGVTERIFALKIDLNGNIIWGYYYPDISINPGRYFIRHLLVVNNNIYITGYKTNQLNDGSTFLLCINGNGTIKWVKQYSMPYSSSALSIINTIDSKLMLLGSTDQTSDGTIDALLLKVDLDGIPEQSFTFGGFLDEGFFGGKQYDNGDLILAGNTNSFNMLNLTPFLMKMDSTGNIKWGTTYDYDFHGSSMTGNDDKIIITAHPFPNILITDTAGVLNKSFYTGGVVSYGMPYSKLTPDGGFISVGTTQINSQLHLYLFKTDSLSQTACYSSQYTVNEFNWQPLINPVNITYDSLELSIDSGFTNNAFALLTYTFCSTSTDLAEINFSFEGFNLFPNPAKDYIIIKNPNYLDSRMEFQILDLPGKIIHGGIMEAAEDVLINIGHFNPGYYFVRILSAGGTQISILKFIKTE
jgi:hypothetical protein